MTALRDRALAKGVVIVGAGQAGGRAAEALRAAGFAGSVTLIGNEVERPYERPSLSKEMLCDISSETITWLHSPDFYREQDIDLRLGIAVASIDRAGSAVVLSDGSRLDYGVLLLATGSRARRLDIPGAEHCAYIRSLEDSRSLRDRLQAGRHLVVVGAGFIGLEVAAAAIERGCRVTVIEVGSAPLGRVAPPLLQDFYTTLHAQHGVSFRFGTQVVAIRGEDGAHRVETDTGERIEADLVVAGIGAIPNDELAMAAGLGCDRGIRVDAFGATDDPSIFAAGDVARHFNPLLDRQILLESWQNAQDQAIAISRNLASAEVPQPYAAIPWFWSDQYGANLQIYGMLADAGELVTRGDPGSSSWIVAQFTQDRIQFAAGINAARDLRPVRELMKLGASVSQAAFADATTKTADLLRIAKSSQVAA